MSNRIFSPPKDPKDFKPIVPKTGDKFVVHLPWEMRHYQITGVYIGGHGYENYVECIPTDFRQIHYAPHQPLRVPLCMLQPFLAHKDVIEGYQEDIDRLMKKRAAVREKALKKLTAEEKEALGLL